MYILFITYFVGQYWLIFVKVISLVNNDSSSSSNDGGLAHFKGTVSFIWNDDWDFTENSPYESTIIAMYFALTSLSTTGFGDYYPKNQWERLLSSFMLLGGVSIFSYVLSQFRWMINNL